MRLSRKYPRQQSSWLSQAHHQHTMATMCVWNLILAVTTILTKTIHSWGWSADCQAHAACDWCSNDHDLWPLNMQSLQPNLTFVQSRFQFIFLWRAQNMTWLTKLLNGPVCTPRQFQCHVDSPPLVLHPLVCLEGDSRASSLWDNGHQLEMKEVWSSSTIKLIKVIYWNGTKLFCLWQMFISTPPFLHSWIDLSPLGWCGRWLDPAQPATHNEHFHRDAAPHVPDGPSSAREIRHTVNVWFYKSNKANKSWMFVFAWLFFD